MSLEEGIEAFTWEYFRRSISQEILATKEIGSEVLAQTDDGAFEKFKKVSAIYWEDEVGEKILEKRLGRFLDQDYASYSFLDGF